MTAYPIGTCDLCGALDVPVTVLAHDVLACMPCLDAECDADAAAWRFDTEGDE
jgi:hypothetical protein